MELKFQELLDRWREETELFSDPSKIIYNDNYLRIVGMGPDVVPLILAHIKSDPHLWAALGWITGANPVPKETEGNLPEVAEAWIEWGKSFA